MLLLLLILSRTVVQRVTLFSSVLLQFCYYCRYKSVVWVCVWLLWMLLLLLWLVKVLLLSLLKFSFVLAGGCCLVVVLLRTVKRINLCLFFVVTYWLWIRLLFLCLLCWWFYRIVFVFFFAVYFLVLFFSFF